MVWYEIQDGGNRCSSRFPLRPSPLQLEISTEAITAAARDFLNIGRALLWLMWLLLLMARRSYHSKPASQQLVTDRRWYKCSHTRRVKASSRPGRTSSRRLPEVSYLPSRLQLSSPIAGLIDTFCSQLSWNSIWSLTVLPVFGVPETTTLRLRLDIVI